MKIGVMSDSHGDMRGVTKAFQIFKDEGCEVVFYLGDGVRDVAGHGEAYGMEVHTVRGNMDYAPEVPLEEVVVIDGVRFFLSHGHSFEIYRNTKHLLKRAKEENCQVAFHGHTHVPYNQKEEGVLILNPGSVTKPRGNSQASLAVIDTRSGDPVVRILPLWEVGMRDLG